MNIAINKITIANTGPSEWLLSGLRCYCNKVLMAHSGASTRYVTNLCWYQHKEHHER